jgi:hypothetical protein
MDEARGRECQIRLPGCNGNPETTVFAHYRLAGTCGVSQKPPSTNGAFACSHCHDVCDGRVKTTLDRDHIRLAHADGVMRTLAILAQEGYRLKRAA